MREEPDYMMTDQARLVIGSVIVISLFLALICLFGCSSSGGIEWNPANWFKRDKGDESSDPITNLAYKMGIGVAVGFVMIIFGAWRAGAVTIGISLVLMAILAFVAKYQEIIIWSGITGIAGYWLGATIVTSRMVMEQRHLAHVVRNGESEEVKAGTLRAMGTMEKHLPRGMLRKALEYVAPRPEKLVKESPV